MSGQPNATTNAHTALAGALTLDVVGNARPLGEIALPKGVLPMVLSSVLNSAPGTTRPPERDGTDSFKRDRSQAS
jgi:hypothetical protein